jgi:hypothetical protein
VRPQPGYKVEVTEEGRSKPLLDRPRIPYSEKEISHKNALTLEYWIKANVLAAIAALARALTRDRIFEAVDVV